MKRSDGAKSQGGRIVAGFVENQERLDRMRQAMSASEIDALILRLPENVLLLSGFWPMIGATTLVFPLEGEPHCILPACYEQEASDSLWSCRRTHYSYGVLSAGVPAESVKKILQAIPEARRWKRIGYEGSFETVAVPWNSAEAMVQGYPARFLAELFPTCESVDAAALLKTERSVKTEYEIIRLRRASEISCFGLEAFEDAVRVGISGVELVAAVEAAVMVRGTKYGGATRVRGYAQVACGAHESAVGYRPNEISTVKRLLDGDVALLELGVVADGYWADRTRVRVAGTPRDEQVKVFDTVRRAQEAATAALRPGVAGSDVDAAARSIIEEAGYGAYFPHITGHGLGFGYHETTPILSPASNEPLAVGMLTSIEPGIYAPSFGGFRIEDDVLVTRQGREVLGAFHKEIH
jgi:Xaa-Pro dipeptidase